MDPTERALLDAIVAHPDDDTPRLVYADWLDEHDRGPRAEFIRVQCAHAAIRYGSPEYAADTSESRAFDLGETYEREWVAELRVPANRNTTFQFRRGMVGAVWCNVRYFLNHHAALIRAAPIQSILFRKFSSGNLNELAKSPGLRTVRGVEFLLTETTPELVMRYLRAVPPTGLTSLELVTLGVSPNDPVWLRRNTQLARAIASAPMLNALTRLDLRFAGIGEEGARALIASPHIQNLNFLQVEHNGIGEVVERELRDRFGDAVVLGQSDYARFTLGELGWW